MEDFELHVRKMEFVYKKLKSVLDRDSLDYLMQARAYFHQEQRILLEELEIYKCTLPELSEEERTIFEEMGCFSENGHFILEGRYLIPVYSPSGKLITLIGWFNDYKKYITLPTKFFSKKVDWFNIENALELSFNAYDGLVFAVEGIFDAYSLRSIGLPVVATMGADVSKSKGELLKIFKKVVSIPDNDKTGKKAIYDRYRQWNLPHNSTYLDIRGVVTLGDGKSYPVKDVDRLVAWFQVEGVREMLLDVAKSNDKYYILNL
ncbi:toprim domain-containing protein [Bacillus thuringiensis]|uniref:DNA primase n=4 Tax=Bacillus TaxID=1386 RepID=A0A0B5NLH3_BACTU|nr:MULTISPECIES: toprim domain-containing protein [Bacillus]EAO56496.1 DNA primase [Bacillus thuringiensis serovar israelensis ATCC 35646]MEC2534114.1 toprim domain-containing protein [Bacillus cereus]MED1153965.1 toprim domain-containing protein [Bacillus paranthracis]OUB09197.1 DNA primase [Bacillus thuringiensis serovar yunnanensis]AFQ29837.1 DNA primase [Bacillus thuringiensis HD-789]